MFVTHLGEGLPQKLLRLRLHVKVLGVTGDTRRPKLKLLVSGLESATGALASDDVPTVIPENPKEPRPERPLHVESGQRLPRLHESLLERVLGFVWAAKHSEGDTEARSLIRSYDGLVESRTACLAQSNQLSFDLRLQYVSSLLSYVVRLPHGVSSPGEFGHPRHHGLDLLFRVVVVWGDSNRGLDALVIEIEDRVVSHGKRSVDPLGS